MTTSKTFTSYSRGQREAILKILRIERDDLSRPVSKKTGKIVGDRKNREYLSDKAIKKLLHEIEGTVKLRSKLLKCGPEFPPHVQTQIDQIKTRAQQILNIIENSHMKHFRAMLDEMMGGLGDRLSSDLKALLAFLEMGEPKPRTPGRPEDPQVAIKKSLVRELAHVWEARFEKWPTKAQATVQGRFNKFVAVCVSPADIEVSEYAVTEGVARGPY